MSQDNSGAGGHSQVKEALLAFRQMKARLDAVERMRNEPIAVIGMACRFPGNCNSPEEFWSFLETGGDAITEVPRHRIENRTAYNPDATASIESGVRFGAFLTSIDQFDPQHFGISPREAARMDPQQRLVLEVAWEALEDAGLAVASLTGQRGAVMIGICNNDYSHLLNGNPANADVYSLTGNSHSIVAGRLSYLLDLTGPSLPIDTACSSSLVAAHLACQSLRSADCDFAIVGGVNVLLSPLSAAMVSRLQALAPDGRCKTFDARANGFVRGEGCGVAILRRQSDAQKNGDRIYAVIRGSAVNQDGRSVGLTAPSVRAQQEVIRRALDLAGVKPSRVGFIETHGTGTSLGDPIEVDALREVYGRAYPAGYQCVLGAVKTNIGHLEGAAGIAGLIKLILCLKKGWIPANQNFASANPRLRLEASPFILPTALQPWPDLPEPRVAAISSFGVAGTNAHLILEQSPDSIPSSARFDWPLVLPVSASFHGLLHPAVSQLSRHLEHQSQSDSLYAACATAATRRNHHEYRAVVSGSSAAEMREECQRLMSDLSGHARGAVHSRPDTSERPKVVLVFPGQGSQWHGMARTLLNKAPPFRAAMQACDEAIMAETGWSLIERLINASYDGTVHPIDVVQPMLFSISVGLAALWKHFGVVPDTVVGHSMGEVAACFVAGVLSLEHAVQIICRRSRLLRQVSGQGLMALLELGLDDAKAALVGCEHAASVAANNAPRSTVVSGNPETIRGLVERLEKRGIFCRLIKVDVASHSPQMDDLLPVLREELSGVKPTAGSIPIFSTVFGHAMDGTNCNAEYWCQNLRRPVLFASTVTDLVKSGSTAFVELSPHPILVPSIEAALTAQGEGVPMSSAFASLQRETDDLQAFAMALGELFAKGVPVAWDRYYTEPFTPVPLPLHVWQHDRYWIEDASASAVPRRFDDANSAWRSPFITAEISLAHVPQNRIFEGELGLISLPWLSEHRVLGNAVLPATAYLEMACAAVTRSRSCLGSVSWILEDVVLHHALFIPEEGVISVQITLKPRHDTSQDAAMVTDGEERFQISSQTSPDGVAKRWILHAEGMVRAQPKVDVTRRAEGATSAIQAPQLEDALEFTLSDVRSRFDAAGSVSRHYSAMREHGIEYGVSFQGVVDIRMGQGEVLGQVRAPATLISQLGSFTFHPALFDACFQLFGAAVNSLLPDGASHDTYVPVRIRRSWLTPVGSFLESNSGVLWVHAKVQQGRPGWDNSVVGDLRLWSAEGEFLGRLDGLELQRLQKDTVPLADKWLYRQAWVPMPLPRPTEGPPQNWLVVCRSVNQASSVPLVLEALTKFARSVCLIHVDSRLALETVHVSTDVDANVQPDSYTCGADRDTFADLLRKLAARNNKVFDAAVFCATAPEVQDALAGGDIETVWQEEVQTLLVTVQALAFVGWRDLPRLFLVAQDSQAVLETDGCRRLVGTGLAGMLRSVAYELPTLRCCSIDLPSDHLEALGDSLSAEFANCVSEDLVAFRINQRYVARLEPTRLMACGARQQVTIKPDGAYLVTGAFGGLGIEVVRWLLRHNAGQIICVGRHPTPIEGLRPMDELAAADVSDWAALEAVVWPKQLRALPICGIVHCAGVLSDGIVLNQSYESVATVSRPKVTGSWNLHRLSQELSLDFLVLFSSGASLLGSPGQSNYSAANAFMDGLAHFRRNSGRPAISINWGPWSSVGLASQHANRGARLAQLGLEGINPEEGILYLEQLLSTSVAQIGVLPLTVRRWREANPALSSAPFFSLLLEREVNSSVPDPRSRSSISDEMVQAAIPERRALLELHLREQIGRVVRMSPERIDRTRPLGSLGIDSLMGLQIRNRLESSLGLTLSTTLLWTYPSIVALATHLAERLNISIDVASAPSSAPSAAAAALKVVLEGMSEEDMADRLAQKLKDLKKRKDP